MKAHCDGHYKVYVFPFEFFQKFFGETGVKVFNLVEGLPEDAKLVGVRTSWSQTTIELLVESSSFGSVTDGAEIPYGQIVFRDVRVL